MSRSFDFPNKYYIIWLDANIEDPEYGLQLKRGFFTSMNPDRFTHADSEIPINFDSFRFTVRAFVDQTSCLKYMEDIQHHRILFITSSTLGQSAVEKLLEKYRHSFTNKNTNQPYDSIYIFCSNIEETSEWAFSYIEYVKIFDCEKDLLTRMVRDLGEEFLNHGQKLIEINQNQSAIERLSWAKSLFIRYDALMSSKQGADRNPSSVTIGQPRPSEKLMQIDQLLDTAEKRIKHQSRYGSDQDDLERQIIGPKVSSPVPSHHIICFHELSLSSERIEIEDRYKTGLCRSTPGQTDDSRIQSNAQFERELRACFLNIPGTIEIHDHLFDYRRSIFRNTGSEAIFLVMSDFPAEEMFEYTLFDYILELYCLPSIKGIYILGNYFLPADRYYHHRRHGHIHIHVFDHYNDLLIQLLQDISRYYQLQGKYCQNSASSSAANSGLIYFDWAKEMITRANQLVHNSFKDQMNSINKHQNELKMLIEQRLNDTQHNEDRDSMAVIFIVGIEVKIPLPSSIAELVTCTTNDQIISTINKMKLSSPFIVASSTPPPDNVLSLVQLLNYYYLLKSKESPLISTKDCSNVIYVSSIDQLINQLYHKLGQHYRDRAIQESRESRNVEKAKRLLNRSTECYEFLKVETQETLKRYDEILNKK